ncbi:hypothetical protein HAX54_019684 [Datura stramonium]|uniref:F-box associated beta-propeller type 1 domain-containing protein n=1 Tax=Datura stramonium TaxID=4076 RepID=A0ABS8Y3T9_DATST|nr:hypothetical protein [Datura stramonium]
MDNVRFAWWNPATKHCRLILRVKFDLKETFNECCRILGIGFDKTNQDYKIVWFRTFMDEMTNDLYPKIFAALYSTKNDLWKYLEPNFSHECQISISQNFTYQNGIYYWMTTGQVIRNKENVYSFLTFDFATELFGKMPGPPIPGDCWATLLATQQKDGGKTEGNKRGDRRRSQLGKGFVNSFIGRTLVTNHLLSQFLQLFPKGGIITFQMSILLLEIQQCTSTGALGPPIGFSTTASFFPSLRPHHYNELSFQSWSSRLWVGME